LISRYTRPAIGAVWSDERRFQRWLDVEIAAMAAWAELGVVPADAVEAVRTHARIDVDRIGEIERRTHHDVLAFTESVSELVGEHGRWFHYGLTSSDVVDTGLALQLRDAGELLLAGLDAVEAAAVVRAEEFRHTPIVGRTHGVHAEPTTFGLKVLGWVTELRRQRVRLQAGAVGGTIEGVVSSLGLLYTTLARGEDRIQIPNNVVLSAAVVPLREPDSVDVRVRLRSGIRPSHVQKILDDQISTPTRNSAVVLGEELLIGRM